MPAHSCLRLVSLLTMTVVCVLSSGCATTAEKREKAADTTEVRFRELARTIAALSVADRASISAWEEMPVSEVVSRLLVGTSLQVHFHSDVNQYETISGARGKNLAATLDVIAGQIGATWHPIIGGICFDTSDRRSTDGPVIIKYIVATIQDRASGLDSHDADAANRFAMRHGNNLEIVEMTRNGAKLHLTLRGFLSEHLSFVTMLNLRLVQAALLQG